MRAKRERREGVRHAAIVPHRERLGEWAPLLLLLFTLSLWLLWPRLPKPSASPRRLPEPGAAYVKVTHGDLLPALRADRFARGTMVERASGGLLPLTPPLAPPPLPPAPPYSQTAVAALSPAPAAPLTMKPMPLIALPAPPPLWNAPEHHEGAFQMQLTPALEAAGFTLDTATLPAVTTDGEARFFVTLAADGTVAHLLLEEASDEKEARHWYSLLERASATNSASGRVALLWHAAAKAP